MRYRLIALLLVLCSEAPATAQVSIGIGFPNVSIGINLPLYPELVPVPGYPVYYAPRLDSNYFFYDGMYWVYQEDNWYASSWYNGPWARVDPEAIPVYLLRVPVRYYRQPPVYFRGWRSDAPPHWGEHWGSGWAQRRSGWDRWSRSAALPPAPLPVYQRQYSGNRYPKWEQQRGLHSQNYRYQPQDPVVRQQYPVQRVQNPPAPPMRGTQGVPQERQGRQPQQGVAQHQQPDRRAHSEGATQGKRAVQEPGRGQGPGQGRGREKADGRGQDHQR